MSGVSDSVGVTGKSLKKQSAKPTPNQQKGPNVSQLKKHASNKSDGENEAPDFKTTTLRFTNNNFCLDM